MIKGERMKRIRIFSSLCAVLLLICILAAIAGCGMQTRKFSLKTRTLVTEERYGADIGYKKYDDGSIIIVDHNGTGAVEIPATLDGMPVVELAASLFEGREDIISLKLPDSIEIIGDLAFFNCTALASVELGDSVWSIGLDAFRGTPWLDSFGDEFAVVGDGVLIKYNGDAQSVILPKEVRHVAGGVFATKTLKSVDLGSVFTLGKNAFNTCNTLIRVDGGDSLVMIGAGAFENCVCMEEIMLPKTLLEVRENAFAACRELAVVVYYGTDVEFTHLSLGAGNDVLADGAIVIYRTLAD